MFTEQLSKYGNVMKLITERPVNTRTEAKESIFLTLIHRYHGLLATSMMVGLQGCVGRRETLREGEAASTYDLWTVVRPGRVHQVQAGPLLTEGNNSYNMT